MKTKTNMFKTYHERISLFLLIFAAAFSQISAQSVLTLGTFHFDFPNLDAVRIDESDQIDVFDPKYQKEIELLTEKLLKFKPTIIVIEQQPSEQQRIDSLYNLYRSGQYKLGRSECEQIGFRLAGLSGLEKLWCVDEWGGFNENVIRLLENEAGEEFVNFEKSFSEKIDSTKEFRLKNIFKSEGIIAELRQLNDEENIKRDLGNYLINTFKYESTPYDFTGVDFETGRWFNRNLKIFRNIQRIKAEPSDRILVIFGAGHLNILNWLFECSPEFELVKTGNCLR